MTTSPPQPPFTLESLATILRNLRDPDHGCPWDREQDFASIAPYTIEEAYEVADAIDRADMPALCDELGDLLLQTVYHAQMASEIGAFTLDDVVASVCAKMIRRHPHVYAAAEERSSAGQTRAWEEQKAAERGTDAGTLSGVALALPALLRANKIQKRAARVGFDWPDSSGPRAKILEELAEIDAATSAAERTNEVGDLLFSVVNYARHLDIEPEAALRDATARFERRFATVEQLAAENLAGASLTQLDEWWSAAKARESAQAKGGS
jgi:nucleoside triphosphate diphosphatase